MKRRLPWVPKYCRDLARDVVDPDTLPPDAREWYLRFLDEYYSGTPHGISAPEHLAESSRRKSWEAREDLFSYGLRADKPPPDTAGGSDFAPSVLDTPEAQELLRKLREVRPEFDETDGRRRARFKSPLVEQRFHALRAQLQALIAEEEQ